MLDIPTEVKPTEMDSEYLAARQQILRNICASTGIPPTFGHILEVSWKYQGRTHTGHVRTTRYTKIAYDGDTRQLTVQNVIGIGSAIHEQYIAYMVKVNACEVKYVDG